MFNLLAFTILAFFMGFLEAIPIGATQFEIARRSIHGHISSALMVVAGSVLSDTMYGIIAFWGVARFLQEPKIVALFWLFGAGISLVLGIMAIREGRARRGVDRRSAEALRKRSVGLITGFSLALTNPFMIAYWLIGAHLMKGFGLLSHYSGSDYALFLAAGSFGIGSYLSCLAVVVFKVKRFFSEQAIRKMSVAFGVALLTLAAYFVVRTLLVSGAFA
jgi:threonine/homoserine/homoserine lactone efflux protein